MSATEKKGHERRVDQRFALFGEVPAQIFFRGEPLSFLIVDISKRGLGLLLTPCPQEGDEISLVFNEGEVPPIHFIIKHLYRGNPVPGNEDQNLLRCGICLSEQNGELDLIDIFTRHTLAVITD